VRLGIGILIGFSVALYLFAEIQTPWAFLLLICGAVTQYVLRTFVIEPLFKTHPKLAPYNHARLWAKKDPGHLALNVRNCGTCQP
jgi:hypothetical protein